jgi:23S rRNA (pseudouridine1915-N3)-methyltransferase
MKIELWSIGKPNEKMYDAAITEFSKRINRYNSFEVRCIPSKANVSAPVAKQMQEEALQINTLLQTGDKLIILDDKCKAHNTTQMANALQNWLNISGKRLVFLIGGSYGIDSSLKSVAFDKISLSALTFPHQLVRLVFCEQLYRCFSVLNNEAYHHE